MKKNDLVKFRFILIALVLIFSSIPVSADSSGIIYQRTGGSRKNASGGYDFYGSSGQKAGYSAPSRKGGYSFFDNKGNKIGTLKQNSRSRRAYTYYDASGIRKGYLKKSATGGYYYQDVQSGKIVNSLPQTADGVGSLSPGVFQGDGK